MSVPARELNNAYMPLPERPPVRHTTRRKSLNLSKSRLPALIMVLLLSYLAISVGAEFSKISSMQRDVLSIQQEVQALQQKNSALRQELQVVQSDAFVEKTAREKLGLVKQGETRVLTVEPGTKLKPLELPSGTNTIAD